MSIPCNNRVVCHCENTATLKSIKKWFTKNSRDFIDFDTNEEDALDFDMDHDYGFPVEMMQRMTAAIPTDDSLHISVLTHDQGHQYIAHHEYKDNKWSRLYENNVHPLSERLEHHTKQ